MCLNFIILSFFIYFNYFYLFLYLSVENKLWFNTLAFWVETPRVTLWLKKKNLKKKNLKKKKNLPTWNKFKFIQEIFQKNTLWNRTFPTHRIRVGNQSFMEGINLEMRPFIRFIPKENEIVLEELFPVGIMFRQFCLMENPFAV